MKKLLLTLFFLFLITACSAPIHSRNFNYLTIHQMNEMSNQIGRNSNNYELYEILSRVNKPNKRKEAIDTLEKISGNSNTDYKTVSDSEMILALLYETEKNPNLALHYLESSSNKDNAYSQYLLAQIYTGIKLSSIDIRRNDFIRIKYLKMAAENNYAQAQSELSSAYFRGKGIKKDDNKSIYWLKKACDNNHHESCKSYDNIINTLLNKRLNN